MRIGIIVLCRYSSSRLPGKILLPLYGKPILEYILEKITSVVPKDSVVVCTSDLKTDDSISTYCTDKGYNCFRGSLDNVAQRFLNCADHYQFDYIVRINGDNLFLDNFLYCLLGFRILRI
jgi:spore coat polysaccharide biosynthesis protein SpsF